MFRGTHGDDNDKSVHYKLQRTKKVYLLRPSSKILLEPAHASYMTSGSIMLQVHSYCTVYGSIH